MTDEQFRALRQIILDLSVRVAELELHLKRQDQIADTRHKLMYEWCAPPAYKQMVETEISMPREPLEEFLNRIKS